MSDRRSRPPVGGQDPENEPVNGESAPEPVPPRKYRDLPTIPFNFDQDDQGKARPFAFEYTVTDAKAIEAIERLDPPPSPKERKILPNGRPQVTETLVWLHDYEQMVQAGFIERDRDGFWHVQVYWATKEVAPANVVM
jgi:hypothetical protein